MPGSFREGTIDMTGFRTLLFNGLMVVAAALLPWLAGIDWTQYVSPTVAVIVGGAINIGLRFVTKTPVGKAQ